MFRTALWKFNRWSEAQAREFGPTHTPHRLLLVLKGQPTPAARPFARSPSSGNATNRVASAELRRLASLLEHPVADTAPEDDADEPICRGPTAYARG